MPLVGSICLVQRGGNGASPGDRRTNDLGHTQRVGVRAVLVGHSHQCLRVAVPASPPLGSHRHSNPDLAPLDNPGRQDVSRLYVANLNHFGRAGGFDAILARMDPDCKGGAASLDEVATYVGVLLQGSRVFVPAWGEG